MEFLGYLFRFNEMKAYIFLVFYKGAHLFLIQFLADFTAKIHKTKDLDPSEFLQYILRFKVLYNNF